VVSLADFEQVRFFSARQDLTIKNCEKSVELNPENKNGVEMLKKIKGE
jgi:hypothetical protein